MNILMAFLQLITILVIAFFEYKRGSLSVFLWATLLVMFGIPHFASVLFGLHEYEPIVMMLASVFVILFNFMYLATRVIVVGRKRGLHFGITEDFADLNTGGSLKDKVLVQVLFLGLFASAAIITYYSRKMFGGILDTSWGGLYAMSASPYDFGSDIGSLRLASLYLLFASGGVVIPLWFQRRYASALAAMALIMYYALITRNRITILPLFVTLILIYMLENRRIGARQLVFLGLVGVLIIYVVYALRLFRHQGTVRSFLVGFSRADFNRSILEMILEGDGELGLRNVFYYFLSRNNDFPNFGRGHSYIRLFLIAIPTKYSLGLKPPDFAITMGSAYMNDYGNTTFSTHPTLYGDCYANLGWCGILLGIFWAIFASFADRLANRKNVVIRLALMVLCGCTYVIMGRGSVYNGAHWGLISGLYLLFWDVVLSEKVRRQNSSSPSSYR